MNLMLNMKDINKISAKTHFKCKKKVKKPTFLRKHVSLLENHRSVASHRQTLSHNVVSSTPRHEWDSNSQH
jgi:hypothetical protein